MIEFPPMSYQEEMRQKEAQMDRVARECYIWLQPRLSTTRVPLYFEAAASVLSDRFFQSIATDDHFTSQERALRLFGHDFGHEGKARYAITYAQAVARCNVALWKTGKTDIFDAKITSVDDESFTADKIRRDAIRICGILGAQEKGISPVELHESFTARARTKVSRMVGKEPGLKEYREVADIVEQVLDNSARQENLKILANTYTLPEIDIYFGVNSTPFIVVPSQVR